MIWHVMIPVYVKSPLIPIAIVVSMSRHRSPNFEVDAKVRDSGLQERVLISQAGCIQLALVHEHGL